MPLSGPSSSPSTAANATRMHCSSVVASPACWARQSLSPMRIPTIRSATCSGRANTSESCASWRSGCSTKRLHTSRRQGQHVTAGRSVASPGAAPAGGFRAGRHDRGRRVRARSRRPGAPGAALRLATTLADTARARLRIVAVFEPLAFGHFPTAPPSDLLSVNAAARSALARRPHEAAAEIQGVDVDPVLLDGDAADRPVSQTPSLDLLVVAPAATPPCDPSCSAASRAMSFASRSVPWSCVQPRMPSRTDAPPRWLDRLRGAVDAIRPGCRRLVL